MMTFEVKGNEQEQKYDCIMNGTAVCTPFDFAMMKTFLPQFIEAHQKLNDARLYMEELIITIGNVYGKEELIEEMKKANHVNIVIKEM